MPPSFIESGFTTKVEYEASLRRGGKPVATAADGPITVYYWGPLMMNMYGRCIGVYLTLNQAGAKYEMKPASEAPDGGSFAPPCVVIDGVAMGQTPAILAVLGEKFGLAGTLAYILTELAFWAVAFPVASTTFYSTAGHWPDFSVNEDKAAVLAFIFAGANVARLVVPLRFAAAFALVPWVEENIVQKFDLGKKDDADAAQD